MTGVKACATYLLSVPEREGLRLRTVADLARTDWQQRPQIIIDDAQGVRKPDAMVEAYLGMLEAALADSRAVAVLLEDDLRFNRYLGHNLLSWEPIVAAIRGAHLAASLLTVAREPDPRSTNRIVAVPWFYGSEAIVLSRPTLLYVLDHWHEEDGFPDNRISRLASRVTPLLAHRPSLVQHVGIESTLGHAYYGALDFSRDWRATPVAAGAGSTCPP